MFKLPTSQKDFIFDTPQDKKPPIIDTITIDDEVIAEAYNISMETLIYYNRKYLDKLTLTYSINNYYKLKNKLKILERSLKIIKIIN